MATGPAGSSGFRFGSEKPTLWTNDFIVEWDWPRLVVVAQKTLYAMVHA